MSYSSRPPPPPPTGISGPDSRSQNSNVRIMNPIGETDSSGGIIHGFMQRMSTGSSEVASNSSGRISQTNQSFINPDLMQRPPSGSQGQSFINPELMQRPSSGSQGQSFINPELMQRPSSGSQGQSFINPEIAKNRPPPAPSGSQGQSFINSDLIQRPSSGSQGQSFINPELMQRPPSGSQGQSFINSDLMQNIPPSGSQSQSFINPELTKSRPPAPFGSQSQSFIKPDIPQRNSSVSQSQSVINPELMQRPSSGSQGQSFINPDLMQNIPPSGSQSQSFINPEPTKSRPPAPFGSQGQSFIKPDIPQRNSSVSQPSSGSQGQSFINPDLMQNIPPSGSQGQSFINPDLIKNRPPVPSRSQSQSINPDLIQRPSSGSHGQSFINPELMQNIPPSGSQSFINPDLMQNIPPSGSQSQSFINPELMQNRPPAPNHSADFTNRRPPSGSQGQSFINPELMQRPSPELHSTSSQSFINPDLLNNIGNRLVENRHTYGSSSSSRPSTPEVFNRQSSHIEPNAASTSFISAETVEKSNLSRCKECGCDSFVPHTFKKKDCNICYHQHGPDSIADSGSNNRPAHSFNSRPSTPEQRTAFNPDSNGISSRTHRSDSIHSDLSLMSKPQSVTNVDSFRSEPSIDTISNSSLPPVVPTGSILSQHSGEYRTANSNQPVPPPPRRISHGVTPTSSPIQSATQRISEQNNSGFLSNDLKRQLSKSIGSVPDFKSNVVLSPQKQETVVEAHADVISPPHYNSKGDNNLNSQTSIVLKCSFCGCQRQFVDNEQNSNDKCICGHYKREHPTRISNLNGVMDSLVFELLRSTFMEPPILIRQTGSPISALSKAPHNFLNLVLMAQLDFELLRCSSFYFEDNNCRKTIISSQKDLDSLLSASKNLEVLTFYLDSFISNKEKSSSLEQHSEAPFRPILKQSQPSPRVQFTVADKAPAVSRSRNEPAERKIESSPPKLVEANRKSDASESLVVYNRDKTCVVCQETTVELVQIVDKSLPFITSEVLEDMNTPNNLILLCPTHHKQFDDYYFTLVLASDTNNYDFYLQIGVECPVPHPLHSRKNQKISFRSLQPEAIPTPILFMLKLFGKFNVECPTCGLQLKQKQMSDHIRSAHKSNGVTELMPYIPCKCKFDRSTIAGIYEHVIETHPDMLYTRSI